MRRVRGVSVLLVVFLAVVLFSASVSAMVCEPGDSPPGCTPTTYCDDNPYTRVISNIVECFPVESLNAGCLAAGYDNCYDLSAGDHYCNAGDDCCWGFGYDQRTYYYDGDNDNYRRDATVYEYCVLGNPDIPNRVYAGDFLGNDCDDTVASCTTDCISQVYYDGDNDGYGWGSNSRRSCIWPANYVIDNTDCDDACPTCFPGHAENTAALCSDGKNNNCKNGIDCDDPDCGPFCIPPTECDPGDVATQSCSIPNGDCNQAMTCDATGSWPPGWGTCNLNCVCAIGYSWNAGTQTCDLNPVPCAGDGLVSCAIPNGDCERSRTCNTATGLWGLPYTSTCSLNCACDPGYTYDAINNECDFNPLSCPGDGLVSCAISNGDCERSRTCNTATGVWGLPFTSGCSLNCACDAGYTWDGDSCEAVPCPQCGTPPGACYSYNTYYRDADGDGLGNPGSSMLACSQPGGYVNNNNDCYDGSASCTNDCVTQAYPDNDVDSYGATGQGVRACDAPGSYILDGSDCDDTDALLWNQCCPPGPFDIEIFPKYNTVYWPTVNRWDYAFHNIFPYAGNFYEDTTVAGCWDDADACYDDALGVVVASGTVVDGSGNLGGRSESYCSFTDCTFHGCAWRDCDISQTVCETNCGHTWLPPDTSTLPFGGFSGPGDSRTECCGDDANEYANAGACAISADTSTLCCPANNMFNLDGRCVFEDDCPDIMKGAPVWIVPPSPARYTDVLAQTDGVDSICCEDGEAVFSGGAVPSLDYMCDLADDYSCYTTLHSVQVQPPPLAGTVCPSNEHCVLDLCSYEEPFSVCEESTVCQEEEVVLELEHMIDLYNCTYQGHTTTAHCYPVVDPSSTTLDPACTPVVEEICEVSGDPTTECDVLCAQGGVSCTFACPPSALTCTNHTTYRNCDAPATGSQVCATQYANIQVSSCAAHPVAIANVFGLAPWDCPLDGSSVTPSCPAPDYVVETSVCATQSFCSQVDCNGAQARDSMHNLRCLTDTTDKGFPLFIQGGAPNSMDKLECSDAIPVFDGDVWCPEGFSYSPSHNRCQVLTAACDGGFTGDLENGCDTITPTSALDLDYWGLYDADCVGTTTGPLNTYNLVCCSNYLLTSAIGDYEIYQNAVGEEYIKVY